jgi:hypothetical protein
VVKHRRTTVIGLVVSVLLVLAAPLFGFLASGLLLRRSFEQSHEDGGLAAPF